MKLSVALASTALVAQTGLYPWGPYRQNVNHIDLKRDTPDNGIALCRLQFDSNRVEQGGNGWSTDYPMAEEHLQIRFSEMTPAHVAMAADEPVHWVVDASSLNLFRCPMLLASDVGTLLWQPDEIPQMREYFAKGGFLWADDYWGIEAWEQFQHAFYQVVPGGYIHELSLDHAVFRMWYHVHEVPQISNLNFWQGNDGEVSERGAESPRAELHGGYDSAGRLVAIMSYNTDIADTWEREYDDYEYFNAFAADGYALGINVLLYAMTH